ncbi:MAG TPA: hypothetical protein VL749_00680 [Patescibacteria group bacterium]|nr:hypothetical protein [Patescibacteria group bacterium]
MARQSIPRFDLYGELGVDPSADTVAIEAAYRGLIDREPMASGAAGVRRSARLRLARDWLVDAELRGRYDASRARAAARAAGKPARAGGDIPWPAADLARAEAEAEAEAHEAQGAQGAVPHQDAPTRIEWSATPAAAALAGDVPAESGRAGSPGRRRSRGPAVALGRLALLVALAVAAYAITSNLGLLSAALNSPTASPPPATLTPAPPTLAATILPTTAPTPEPTLPGPTDIPIATLQQGAWDTVQRVQAAATADDLATIQSLVGDTASGLRLSGVRQVEFPPVAVGAFVTQRAGELYDAVADPYHLTSTDGQAWTFDWADRPLAAYRPAGKDIHDLWWTESDGKHHLYLRITVATLSRQSVYATLTWTFDPARPDDATYFKRAAIDVTGVSFDDGPPVLTSGQPVAIVGSTFVITSVKLATPYTGALPSQLVLEITVTNPRTIGGAGRENPTTYTLPIR